MPCDRLAESAALMPQWFPGSAPRYHEAPGHPREPRPRFGSRFAIHRMCRASVPWTDLLVRSRVLFHSIQSSPSAGEAARTASTIHPPPLRHVFIKLTFDMYEPPDWAVSTSSWRSVMGPQNRII